jgi:acyl carrier protein
MDDVFVKVQEALHRAFDIELRSVTIETGPGDIPQWDSLGHMALIASLGSEFGISFDVDDIMAMENVKEILRILKSKYKESL